MKQQVRRVMGLLRCGRQVMKQHVRWRKGLLRYSRPGHEAAGAAEEEAAAMRPGGH